MRESAATLRRPALRGVLYTILSAILFGITPIFVRCAYEDGVNGITMTFLRGAISLPVLAVILLVGKHPFAVTRAQARDMIVGSGFFGTVTTFLMYASYVYIPVGVSTTLHFIYPVLVSVACALVYRDKLAPSTIAALIASVVGVYFTSGGFSGGENPIGIALAVASGATFACNIVYLEKSQIHAVHHFTYAFYVCLMSSAFAGVCGLATGELSLALPPRVWLLATTASLMSAIGASTLLKVGVKMSGATSASILSTFEPITSVALGFLVLGETVTTSIILGGALIIASVIVIAVQGACATGR